MAKEPSPADQNATPKPAAEKQSIFSKKLVLIGIPVFVLQVALLYFVAVKFLGSPSHSEPSKQAEAEESKESGEPAVQNIFVVKDLIVNPAGTNGTRFLLVTVGFELSTPGAQKELEKKEIQLRDALNTILGSKKLEDLAGVERREELRTQISAQVGSLLQSGAVNNVYFSKFIIQ
ncbi:MAG TPA: flagellar basal body-associated FliL family protein [Bacteroidota bacterium]|nr:flagellar basal body-associated FliL family protein [Bacteroidota bacterium]